VFGQYGVYGVGAKKACPHVAVAEVEITALQGEPVGLCCTVCADNYFDVFWAQFAASPPVLISEATYLLLAEFISKGDLVVQILLEG
jgi:hypothetical protein